jgi:hypothetical protein
MTEYDRKTITIDDLTCTKPLSSASVQADLA